MEKQLVTRLTVSFEGAAYNENGIEYWLARELQPLLGYDEWRSFENVIGKAKVACEKAGGVVADHFVPCTKNSRVGLGANREIDDIMLTRYACYLVAQNGDPRKDQIAFAQSYFAIQTRKQELIEERIHLFERMHAREKLVTTETELSKLIYERGVDSQGFGRIRSKGDQALFGGMTTLQMKKKLGVPDNRPLADFLPTITIKAKDLATEITNFNVKKNDLHGEPVITTDHIKNNRDVRDVLAKSGIKPEELPPEEDIKKLERRVKSEEKKILKDTGKIVTTKSVESKNAE
ncbi:MAG TPA: DNA damage-inducible protein D [Fibrobacteres bacterium]|nr:DNA damage-inducible protein D [Fibrobacterota bacterium]